MDIVTSAIETEAPEKNPSQWEFSCDLEVDYKSEENACIIYSALAVDKELQPDKVRRLMSVSNGKLSVLRQLKLDFFVHPTVHLWMF